MTLRLGFREGAAPDPRSIVATAAEKARTIFEELGRAWSSVVGGTAGAGGEGAVALEG